MRTEVSILLLELGNGKWALGLECKVDMRAIGTVVDSVLELMVMVSKINVHIILRYTKYGSILNLNMPKFQQQRWTELRNPRLIIDNKLITKTSILKLLPSSTTPWTKGNYKKFPKFLFGVIKGILIMRGVDFGPFWHSDSAISFKQSLSGLLYSPALLQPDGIPRGARLMQHTFPCGGERFEMSISEVMVSEYSSP